MRDFVTSYSTEHKARYSYERRHRDLFSVTSDYAQSHRILSDLVMNAAIAEMFKKKFGGLESKTSFSGEIEWNRLRIGQIGLQIRLKDLGNHLPIYHHRSSLCRFDRRGGSQHIGC